jgi:hypothetical protein
VDKNSIETGQLVARCTKPCPVRDLYTLDLCPQCGEHGKVASEVEVER